MNCEKKYRNGGIKNIFTHFLSLILSIFVLLVVTPVYAQQISVSITPSSQDVSHHSNTEITVNVNIQDVSDLYGFQLDVRYNQTVLSFINATEGNFLKSDGASTHWLIPNTTTPGLINNIASTRQATTTSVSGSGNLAQIKFRINPSFTGVPTTTQIRLLEVKLSDKLSQPVQPFSVNNGSVNIRICLNGETKSCGSSIGECIPGTQTCSNYQWGSCTGGVGPATEICDGLDNDCDGRSDNVQDTANPLTQSCSVRHVGICAVGTETCSTGAWSGCPSPQQEICWDNIDQDCNGADSQCEGDINDDGCIDISDLAIVAVNFGRKSGFDSRADVKTDGEIDIYDLVIVAKDFGSGSSC